ncbi:DNA mismatch endonuclease Vsr [Glycocaulis profundi]|nr:DNA mismatch endonuclease Vsr [Glycocaulis profundi]
MTDPLSPQRRSELMGRVRQENTTPEMRVRSVVHRLGFRYRLHRRDLPGSPDLVFGPRRKVIFVHGCFWHLHPGCKGARIPASRREEYWLPKLTRNVRRDADSVAALEAAGWRVLTVWECETKNEAALERGLLRFLNP